MENNLLYHGSAMEVIYPEIRITRYTKDFSWGFYCTNSYEQAYRWADRRSSHGIVNVYKYTENPELKILHFPKMNDVNGFVSGKIPRNVFWEYAKFKHPTHQISFHTINALRCLEFERSEPIYDRETER